MAHLLTHLLAHLPTLKPAYLFVAALFLVLGMGLPRPEAGAAEAVEAAGGQPRRTLAVKDCIKCHKNVPGEIEEKGMAHKTEITCLDCHPGHPPAMLEIIPPCSNCHEDAPHFRLPACLTCHTNPHTPLEIDLSGGATDACLTCHEEPGEQFRQFPSFHASLACTSCHAQHGRIPACVDCHRTHSFAIGPDDCRLCHQPHKPLAIEYGSDLASKNCAACHQPEFDRLTAGRTKHRQLNCVACHASPHRTIPACGNCHASPHQRELLAKFPDCGHCHGSAHDPAAGAGKS